MAKFTTDRRLDSVDRFLALATDGYLHRPDAHWLCSLTRSEMRQIYTRRAAQLRTGRHQARRRTM